MHVYKRVDTCGRLGLYQESSSTLFPLIHLGGGSPSNPKRSHMTGFASLLGLRFLHLWLLRLELQLGHHAHLKLMSPEGPNSGPHVRVARALTEDPP